MKQSTKDALARKLTSRKFWLTVAGLIGTLCASIGFGDALAAKIASVVTSGGLIVAYVFGESLADAAYGADTGKTVLRSDEEYGKTERDTE